MYKYIAFISYSHKDKRFAKKLFKFIEKYKIPKEAYEQNPSLPKNLKGKLFLDEEELNSGIELNDGLKEKIKSSKNLIVVCSPNAVKSKWIDKEIIYFKTYNKGKIIPIIHKGNPYSEPNNAIPKALMYEVINGKISSKKAPYILTPIAKGFFGRQRAFVQVLSGILDVDFATLWQRHKRYLKFKIYKIIGFSLLIGIIIAILSFNLYTFISDKNKIDSINNLKEELSRYEYQQRHYTKNNKEYKKLQKKIQDLKHKIELKSDTLKWFKKENTPLLQKIYKIKEEQGIQKAIDTLSYKDRVEGEHRLKEISKEYIALAKLYVENNQIKNAHNAYNKAYKIFPDYDNAIEFIKFLTNFNYDKEAIYLSYKVLRSLGHDKNSIKAKIYLKENLVNIFIKNNQNLNIIQYFNDIKHLISLLPKSEQKEFTQNLNILSANVDNKLNTKSKKITFKNTNYYNMLFQAIYIENQALRLKQQGELNKALQNMQKATDIFEYLTDKGYEYKYAYFVSLVNLATLQIQFNSFKKSLKNYQKALNILPYIKNRDTKYLKASILLNRATIYKNQNHYKKAANDYLKALSIFKTYLNKTPIRAKFAIAYTYSNMALLQSKTDIDAAIKNTKVSNQILKTLLIDSNETAKYEMFKNYMNLISFYGIKKNKQESINSYKKALKLINELKNKNSKLYELDYASLKLIGVRLGIVPINKITTIQKTLNKYPNNPKAKKLLESIKKINKL